MTKEKRQLLHLGLFILTFLFTTMAGAEWIFGRSFIYGEEKLNVDNLYEGFHFSIPFLLILTCHEFGHYLTARYHQIQVTLPFYIPLWFGFLGIPSFGTMGAFIRIKDIIKSRSKYFDVGVAGPLAGFVVALVVIWYGFTSLPEPEYIFSIHPEYEQYGLDYAEYVYDDQQGVSFQFGPNLLFWFFENFVLEDPSLMPHPNEIIHYPYLLAGYLALFFTALNLLPIGQLDGGHVTFGLFGPSLAKRLNEIFFLIFLLYAGMGWVHPEQLQNLSAAMSIPYLLLILYFTYACLRSMFSTIRERLMVATVLISVQYILTFFVGLDGYGGWMLFAFLLGRYLGVYHPPVSDNRPLTMNRQIIGWIAIIVFIVSFSPKPFILA